MKLALLCKLRENPQSEVAVCWGPAQSRSPACVCSLHGQGIPGITHCIWGRIFIQSCWQVGTCVRWTPRRVKGPGVLKPKELRGPETVELREYLKGSGTGMSPNVSRTVMLKKY